ncbi:MAG TPA: helix-turn-helix transcriptional regulator [Ktedonobacteraceae bacterium]|jgi:DNA-binding Xre family transcriptional regulator|nr:helix-turn-helix transcriptional regulator [Ktedonobacteraceae bacterium]
MVRIKVKEIARSKGISQSKLSRLADVNISTIQRIYRNPTDTNINLFTLEKIAKALGVDVSELIESVSDEKQ